MLKVLTLYGLTAAGIFAQTWYAGAAAGYGFTHDLTLKGPAGSADAGLHNGGAVGVLFGQDMFEHWGGEVRYLYRAGSLKLSSGGTTASFAARTHIVHYDFLAHFSSRESYVRPFVAFGAGVRVWQGVGRESSAQPLGQFGALTSTIETLPMGDVGAGVKFNMRKLQFRVEARDYVSGAPNKVIAPAPGMTLNGWLQDIVGLAALSYRW